MEVNTNFYYLIRFIAEFGRAPKAREEYEGKKIGWLFQNIKHGSFQISTEDRDFFTRLGIELDTKNPQELVHEKLIVLIDFLYDEKRIPKYNEVHKGINLGVFFRNILSSNTTLNKDDSKLFKSALKKIN